MKTEKTKQANCALATGSPMSRRHLELAAKLWALALVAHTESESADDETERKIKRLAVARATTKLRRLGTDPAQIICTDDAADSAKRILARRVAT